MCLQAYFVNDRQKNSNYDNGVEANQWQLHKEMHLNQMAEFVNTKMRAVPEQTSHTKWGDNKQVF